MNIICLKCFSLNKNIYFTILKYTLLLSTILLFVTLFTIDLKILKYIFSTLMLLSGFSLYFVNSNQDIGNVFFSNDNLILKLNEINYTFPLVELELIEVKYVEYAGQMTGLGRFSKGDNNKITFIHKGIKYKYYILLTKENLYILNDIFINWKSNNFPVKIVNWYGRKIKYIN